MNFNQLNCQPPQLPNWAASSGMEAYYFLNNVGTYMWPYHPYSAINNQPEQGQEHYLHYLQAVEDLQKSQQYKLQEFDQFMEQYEYAQCYQNLRKLQSYQYCSPITYYPLPNREFKEPTQDFKVNKYLQATKNYPTVQNCSPVQNVPRRQHSLQEQNFVQEANLPEEPKEKVLNRQSKRQYNSSSLRNHPVPNYSPIENVENCVSNIETTADVQASLQYYSKVLDPRSQNSLQGQNFVQEADLPEEPKEKVLNRQSERQYNSSSLRNHPVSNYSPIENIENCVNSIETTSYVQASLQCYARVLDPQIQNFVQDSDLPRETNLRKGVSPIENIEDCDNDMGKAVNVQNWLRNFPEAQPNETVDDEAGSYQKSR